MIDPPRVDPHVSVTTFNRHPLVQTLLMCGIATYGPAQVSAAVAFAAIAPVARGIPDRRTASPGAADSLLFVQETIGIRG